MKRISEYDLCVSLLSSRFPVLVSRFSRQPLVLLNRNHAPNPRPESPRKGPLPRTDFEYDVIRIRIDRIDDPVEDVRVGEEMLS